MNKTLSVNIGGIVFHIEEQAYEKLNRYLDAIRGYFTTSDGRDEIIQDIESRIGEMFQERVTGGRQVVIESDVDHIIEVMGKPEQFALNADEPFEGAARAEAGSRREYRKLYRDPDDRVVSGVCSGLSHYLGLDPIWLRLVFAISFFFFGSGLLLYIILAVIMPKAESTSEKLEMKGEQVNISNIRRSVQEEPARGPRSGSARFFDALGQLIAGAFRLLGKIIAVFFIIIGVIILGSFVIALMAVFGVAGISIPIFITDQFLEPWQQTAVMTGGFLLVGIPLIMIIFLAIKTLFRIRIESRFINWTAFALWIVGVLICITVAVSISKDFRTRETYRTELPIMQPAGDVLYLGVNGSTKDHTESYYMNRHRIRNPWTVTSGEDTVYLSDVRLDIIRSTSDKFELVQITSARGEDRRSAVNNARDISYAYSQTDSLLQFSESFVLPRKAKYRHQKIQLLLKVPEGKSVYMGKDLDYIIYDVDNVTNTYDSDMLGHTWTMTRSGLECIGCGFSRDKDDDIHIRIDDRGIKVHGVDRERDSSLHIDGKDVDINIDGNGVRIDAKKR